MGVRKRRRERVEKASKSVSVRKGGSALVGLRPRAPLTLLALLFSRQGRQATSTARYVARHAWRLCGGREGQGVSATANSHTLYRQLKLSKPRLSFRCFIVLTSYSLTVSKKEFCEGVTLFFGSGWYRKVQSTEGPFTHKTGKI